MTDEGLESKVEMSFGNMLKCAGAAAVGFPFMMGLMTTFYFTSPILVPALGMWGYIKHRSEIEKDEQKIDSMQNDSIRRKFNKCTRTLGNKLISLPNKHVDYGLGDVLTEKINFRRAGAIAGGLAGLSMTLDFIGGAYAQYGFDPNITLNLAAAYVFWPFSIGPPLGGVALGYSLGTGLDKLLGDKDTIIDELNK